MLNTNKFRRYLSINKTEGNRVLIRVVADTFLNKFKHYLSLGKKAGDNFSKNDFSDMSYESVGITNYNLNLDDLLPCYTNFVLLEKLLDHFPQIKITIFMPINSNSRYGPLSNNIFDHPNWCQKIASLPRDNFEFAIHGFYHNLNDYLQTPEFKYLSKKQAKNRLLKCQAALKKMGIKFTKGFRPPRWEMSRGTEHALEELGYLYLSDTPRFFNKHKNIKIPRIFPNSDIQDNHHHCEIRPYQKLLLNPQQFYIHRGHFVSGCDNNLTEQTFNNIIKTIKSFKKVRFKFLSEIAQELSSYRDRFLESD